MKIIFLSFFMVLLLLSGSRTFAQNKVISEDEELWYDVNYGFINIGTVKFKNTLVNADNKIYKCFAVLNSNDALPFVDVHFEFETEYLVENNSLKPLLSVQKEFKNGKTSVQTYNFYYDSGFVRMHKTGFDNEVHFDKKANLDKVYQDGLSIFYQARLKSAAPASDNIPVIINDEISSVAINEKDFNSETEIDEIDYDIRTVKILGHAFFKAVFGLTGDFNGDFSNDEFRVPLKARLEVQIGKVTLELVKWKVNNWKPPKA